MKKIISFIAIICSVILLDQLTKYLVVNNIILNGSITVIKDFFYLTYVQNTGAAFSILRDNVLLLSIIGIITTIILFYLWYKDNNSQFDNIAYAMVIGGTIGNLIDRVCRGYVVDFFHFYIFKYDFPVFNIGDMFIVIGVFLIFISVLVGDKNGKNKNRT